MKAIKYIDSLIAGQKMGSSIPVQVSELEMLKTFLEIEQTITAGRAAIDGAEPVGGDCAPNHLCNGRMVHLPLREQCDKCGGSAT